MEGYLGIRHWGGRVERVWVVLDGQQVTCYERLDLANQTPVNVKKVLNIRLAKIEKISNDSKAGKRDSDTKFGISVSWLKIDGTKKMTIFDCDDSSSCTSWFKALEAGANEHEEEERLREMPMKCAALLGLESLVTHVTGGDHHGTGNEDDDVEYLTRGKIIRAYKKLSLKLHPDRGGSESDFVELNNAYEYLLNYLAHEEELDSTVLIDYEVCVIKAGAGIGLGLSVAYDNVRRQILVKSVNPKIRIDGISEESGGHILAGDALIAIDKDDCSHWKLSRITARLNALRLPVDGKTYLTLERRVPKPAGYDESKAHLTARAAVSHSSHVLKPLAEVASDENAGAAVGPDEELNESYPAGSIDENSEVLGQQQQPQQQEEEEVFDIDEEIKQYSSDDYGDSDDSSAEGAKHEGYLNDGIDEGNYEGTGTTPTESDLNQQHLPSVEVATESERMRRNDSPAFGGAGADAGSAGGVASSVPVATTRQATNDYERESITQPDDDPHQQMNDQYYDIDESFYEPVDDNHIDSGNKDGDSGLSQKPQPQQQQQYFSSPAKGDSDQQQRQQQHMSSPPVRKLSNSGSTRERFGSSGSGASGGSNGNNNNSLLKIKPKAATTRTQPVQLAHPTPAAPAADDLDSEVFYPVDTGLLPTESTGGPHSMRAAQIQPQSRGQPQYQSQQQQPNHHRVRPSNAYDREINALLESVLDPNDLILKLIAELQSQMNTSDRHRNHNDVLTAEVSRLTSENRQLRASLSEADHANETAQLEVLELTSRNESLSSQLHEKFSKVPGAQGRRLMESHEHLIQCNRARKEAASQISGLRYIINNTPQPHSSLLQGKLYTDLQASNSSSSNNHNNNTVAAAAAAVEGNKTEIETENRNDEAETENQNSMIHSKYDEYKDAVRRANDVQRLLQSLL